MKKQIMRSMLVILVLSSLIITGCAGGPNIGNYEPVVMNNNIDISQYQQDLQECRQYAYKRPSMGEGDTQGAVTAGAGGAAMGALVSVITGSHRAGSNALLGGVIGLVGGAVKGAAVAHQRQKVIIIRCMEGKGYNVLSD